MNITLVMASSVNGKITRGDDPDVTSWTSPEDQEHFRAIIDSHSLLFMGRKTYEAGAKRRKLTPGKLRVVFTKHPEKYENIPGQVEYTDESPEILVKRLEKQGYKDALLVGGGQTNAQFFAAGLVTKLFLTIEPYIFPDGRQLISSIPSQSFSIPLILFSFKQLNPQGTLLLHYKVRKK